MVPVEVPGLVDAVAIAAGQRHSCAVTGSGGVKCWGSNAFSGSSETAPKRTRSLLSTLWASRISWQLPRETHTCAIKERGAVLCWGRNDFGQLGDGQTGTIRSVPAQASGLTYLPVGAIAAGGSHTCAIIVDGGMKCWGEGGYGEVGDGGRTSRNVPTDVTSFVDVTNLSRGARGVAAGGNQTCAVIKGGQVKCWGFFYGDPNVLPVPTSSQTSQF